MLVELLLISKLCSELIATRTINIDECEPFMSFKDFKNEINKTFGLHNEFTVFWKYSLELFFEITDFINFTTALLFGAEHRLYILMKDYDEPWVDNLTEMKVIDYIAERAHRKSNQDPYDVRIGKGLEEESENLNIDMLNAMNELNDACPTDADIMVYATIKLPQASYYTTDFDLQATLISALRQVCGYNLLNRLAVTTASFLCLTNILGMKGEIISCPHKDIYFLETNTKSESTDLANMFASPASTASRGHTIKCKPRTKLKQKYNPALDFFCENKATTKSAVGGKEDVVGKCGSSGGNQSEQTSMAASGSRRNSIDLYEEAATILGLTCSQTDDCKCIECQCHYFDFEDDLDFTPLTSSALGTAGGGEYYVDHNSSCAIQ